MADGDAEPVGRLLSNKGVDLSPDLASELAKRTSGNPKLLHLAINRIADGVAPIGPAGQPS